MTEMSLVEHLSELRRRLLISLGAVLIASVGGFVYADKIIGFLSHPVGDSLVYLAPTEVLFTQLKVAVVAGLCAATPILFIQFFRFVSPGLSPRERRYVSILMPLAFLSFAAGATFATLVVLPLSVRFFLGFSTPQVTAMFSLGRYISFALTIIVPFAVVFQLPMVAVFLAKLGLISARTLKERRRYVLVLMFVLAALFTPPDVISQVLLVIPLIILYELSVLLVKITE